MSAAPTRQSTTDFHVADLLLAEWGRKEIAIAEGEMPALSHGRAEATYARRRRWCAPAGRGSGASWP